MSQWSPYRRRVKRAGALTIFIGAALWTGAVVYGQREGGRAAATAPSSAPAGSSEVLAQRALLDRYCVTCHNERLKTRNATPIALDTLDVANVPAHAEDWEKVIAKLRAGLMPPAGMPRPGRRVAGRRGGLSRHAPVANPAVIRPG